MFTVLDTFMHALCGTSYIVAIENFWHILWS